MERRWVTGKRKPETGKGRARRGQQELVVTTEAEVGHGGKQQAVTYCLTREELGPYSVLIPPEDLQLISRVENLPSGPETHFRNPESLCSALSENQRWHVPEHSSPPSRGRHSEHCSELPGCLSEWQAFVQIGLGHVTGLIWLRQWSCFILLLKSFCTNTLDSAKRYAEWSSQGL